MQFKNYNSYSIVHKDGRTEKLNAETMEQALENMSIAESESPVARALMTASDQRTVFQELPSEIVFTAVVDSASVGGGSIATPAEGTVHVGDEIQLRAIPARNYVFVSWSRNGEVISNQAILDYTMTELAEGEDTVIFTASFALADVNWTTEVYPAVATTAGCIAFPSSGTTEANGAGEFLAVVSEGFTFDHWERNGVILSTNKLLQIDAVTPLAEGEVSAVYKAVFLAE